MSKPKSRNQSGIRIDDHWIEINEGIRCICTTNPEKIEFLKQAFTKYTTRKEGEVIVYIFPEKVKLV
jgi:hypothetical protein